MNFKVKRSTLAGDIRIPPSKSHTIRAAVFAGLARGTSVIHCPLKSDDTLACLGALRQLGAEVTEDDNWTVKGFNGRPRVPDAPLDVKNSGTSLRFLSAVAALADGEIEITGDDSAQTRPMEPLLNALRSLGAVMAESKKKKGRAPLTVRGRAAGGMASVDGVTSQFISALLIIAPLLKRTSQLKVVKLNERPYVEITLYWLRKLGIEFTKKGRNNFNVPGGQSYYAFERAIPADFSSATFPLVGALITEGSDVLLKGLDMTDPQGDKKIIDIVKEMGGQVEAESGGVRVKFSELEGDKINLNEMPDALPALAVLGCFAEGETKRPTASRSWQASSRKWAPTSRSSKTAWPCARANSPALKSTATATTGWSWRSRWQGLPPRARRKSPRPSRQASLFPGSAKACGPWARPLKKGRRRKKLR